MAGLADRIFHPQPAEPTPDPAILAEQIRQLHVTVTSAHDLANFWRDHANPVAQAGELRRMDEALDALLELGVGR